MEIKLAKLWQQATTIVALTVVLGAAMSLSFEAIADPPTTPNGPNRIVGTSGDDVLGGGRGPDVLIGKAGDDRLWLGRGPDTAKCGPGYDVVHNNWSTGADTIAASCEEVRSE